MRLFRRCAHETVYCLHGDSILATIRAWRSPMLARVRCTRCGKALYDRELPRVCTVTGTPHYSQR